MRSLVSRSPTGFLYLQFPSPGFRFHSLLLPRENSVKCLRNRKPYEAHSGGASCASSGQVSYGGWDDFELIGDSEGSCESDQFRNFMVSVGVNDRKLVLVFVLGFVSALAISRVRVSSIIVFPASILVFAIGFSFGFVRSGSTGELSVGGNNKRKGKEEISRVQTEKLKNLVELFEESDAQVNKLKYDIQKAIDCREISLEDMENYVKVLESKSLSTLNSRKVLDALIDNNLGSSRPSRKKKELGEAGYKLLQSVCSMFGENSANSKLGKMKNILEQETGKSGSKTGNSGAGDQKKRNSSTTAAVEELDINGGGGNKVNVNLDFSEDLSTKYVLENTESETNISQENGKMTEKFIDSDEYRHQYKRHYHISSKMFLDNETEMWQTHNDGNLLDSSDFRIKLSSTEETEASFPQEQMFRKSSRAFKFSDNFIKSENGAYKTKINECEAASSSSSSSVDDDTIFSKYLTEANDLLKQAKEFMKGRDEEDRTEILLYQSAKLLSKAIALRPMSLLAVGQLGNTYLLHGELKLRISRELRALLSSNDLLVDEKGSGVILKGFNDQIRSKDDVPSVLINICEECEKLLMEAGRKYRLALSIDGSDVRALYNWGLALSFRAQLIADIGPEAAVDADKVFLAAIDKFDAMMSKGNIYAPDALFRWAVTLQQRSRLWSSNKKEKANLLQQAKRLYEDALSMDSNNRQVREALSTCISELNIRNY